MDLKNYSINLNEYTEELTEIIKELTSEIVKDVPSYAKILKLTEKSEDLKVKINYILEDVNVNVNMIIDRPEEDLPEDVNVEGLYNNPEESFFISDGVKTNKLAYGLGLIECLEDNQSSIGSYNKEVIVESLALAIRFLFLEDRTVKDGSVKEWF